MTNSELYALGTEELKKHRDELARSLRMEAMGQPRYYMSIPEVRKDRNRRKNEMHRIDTILRQRESERA